MSFEILVKDVKFSRKSIGIDKGLATIGDGVVNLAYSIAKSLYLTKHSVNNKIIRTGKSVNKKVLSNALKNADMKDFARSRSDAHDMADTAEAIVAYIWLNNKLAFSEIVTVLEEKLSGDLRQNQEENKAATVAFTSLLTAAKKYLPEE